MLVRLIQPLVLSPFVHHDLRRAGASRIPAARN